MREGHREWDEEEICWCSLYLLSVSGYGCFSGEKKQLLWLET